MENPSSKKFSIVAEGLGKRYRLGKSSKAESGLDRIFNILEVFSNRENGRKLNDLWALRDINLEVEQGETVGVIGSNGAGKTTLLKILAQITPPTTGQARVKGRVVSLLELGTGFQPDLTARENIYLSAAFYGIRRQEVDSYFDDLVAFAELEKFADSPVKHFSSGMYVRLAFSNAIHMRPDILLADEVLAVGDIGFQQKCMGKMQEIGAQGVTVLFVSHDMGAVRRLCGRCICLDAGALVDQGETESVVRRYEDGQLGLATDQKGSSVLVRNNAGNLSQVQCAHGAIKAVQLLSSGNEEVGALRTKDDYFLAIIFESLEPGARVLGSFDIYADDVLVFRTWPSEILELPSPGRYRLRVKIPGGLLAEKNYYVSAGVRLDVPDGEKVRLNAHKALMFKGYNFDERGIFSGYMYVRPAGVVNPQLEWDTQHICERGG